MKPMALNLSKMKKVAGDKNSSTFLHPGGHRMVIAHNGVSALQRKQLEKMPVQEFAEGGDAESPDPEPTSSPLVDSADQIAADANLSPPASLPEPAPPPQSANIPGDGAPASDPISQPDASNPATPQTADVAGAYQQGQKAISEQQAVDSAKAKANVQIQQKDLQDRQTMNQNFDQASKELMGHRQSLLDDYAKGHINPDHYVENMGAGQKVATGIGLLLGGFAGGISGQGNPAMDYLKEQINKDIKAQEARLDQQKTILGANEALFHDRLLAQNQTRMNMNDIYDHKVQLEAAKQGTPQAKAAADAAHAQFALQNAGLLQQSALWAAAKKAASDGSMDPAKLVPILVPKEHQAKAFGEIEAAENTRKMSGSILDSFEKAVKENTVLRTGFGVLRTPGSVYALHQAMQPTFKDLEGTVRQAAMDNTFKNITPMPGDAENKIQEKREALKDYLKSKLSAPTARGYGIDLAKFSSTAPMESANPLEGKTATNPQGQKIVMRNGRWVPLGG